MSRQIIWSPLAEKDFADILEYLRVKWDKKVALHFVDLVNNIVTHLSANPKQFTLINKKKRIRKCVITKHNTLYYREQKKEIHILRIYDSRQDPDKLKFL